MIKISELLVRRPGMSRTEFHDYWKRVHGPLVMSIPEVRRHVRKYVQSHTQSDWFDGVKLFELPVRRRGMSRSDCQSYWRNTHGPLVLGAADMIKPLRRYVQSHSFADGTGGLPPMRYDGMAELWFDSREDLKTCFDRQYLDVVHPDELNFVDPARSSALVAREFPIYERA
jgi:uncharacterized protein (TIGR02118 family)